MRKGVLTKTSIKDHLSLLYLRHMEGVNLQMSLLNLIFH